MKKFKNPFRELTRAEKLLWLLSATVVTASFLAAPQKDWLSLLASLVGVTSLIFLARGFVIGQVLMIAFSILYGIVSVCFRYWGEMLTYLGMTAPMAVVSMIAWIRHPYRDSMEVEVRSITKKQIAIMVILNLTVTALFYFLLKALQTPNLVFSTISVTTSFFAAYLTYLRSPWYAVGYAANDVVLIILWILAAIQDISFLPMIFCFATFFINDLYGFLQWKKMQKRQRD